MPKRVSLVLLIIVILAIGVGFTTIDSSSMQSNMNTFENELTTGGVITTIDNSSSLGNIALKIQSLIDFAISTILNFFQKLIGLFM